MSNSIELPKGMMEGIVSAHIQSAVAAAIGKDPNALVRAVVHEAMREQPKGSYGRDKSIFQEKVSELIREVAAAEFRSWLEDQRELIRSEIRAQLDKAHGPDGKESIADQIVRNLSKVDVSVRLGGHNY